MKVTIQNELNEYMHSHDHDTISLKLIHDDYSSGNVYSNHPRIRWHEPKHMENFDKYIVDDITVYVAKNVRACDDKLEFVHEKLLGIHRCHVKGLNLDYVTEFMEQ